MVLKMMTMNVTMIISMTMMVYDADDELITIRVKMTILMTKSIENQNAFHGWLRTMTTDVDNNDHFLLFPV